MAKKSISRGAGEGKPRGPYSVEHRAPGKDLPVVQRFRSNVRTLLEESKDMMGGVTQQKLAEASHLSLRALAAQLSLDSETVPNLRTVQQISDAWGLEPWELLLPDFPARILLNSSLRNKVRTTLGSYFSAEDATREAIDILLSPTRTRDK